MLNLKEPQKTLVFLNRENHVQKLSQNPQKRTYNCPFRKTGQASVAWCCSRQNTNAHSKAPGQRRRRRHFSGQERRFRPLVFFKRRKGLLGSQRKEFNGFPENGSKNGNPKSLCGQAICFWTWFHCLYRPARDYPVVPEVNSFLAKR